MKERQIAEMLLGVMVGYLNGGVDSGVLKMQVKYANDILNSQNEDEVIKETLLNESKNKKE